MFGSATAPILSNISGRRLTCVQRVTQWFNLDPVCLYVEALHVCQLIRANNMVEVISDHNFRKILNDPVSAPIEPGLPARHREGCENVMETWVAHKRSKFAAL